MRRKEEKLTKADAPEPASVLRVGITGLKGRVPLAFEASAGASEEGLLTAGVFVEAS